MKLDFHKPSELIDNSDNFITFIRIVMVVTASIFLFIVVAGGFITLKVTWVDVRVMIVLGVTIFLLLLKYEKQEN